MLTSSEAGPPVGEAEFSRPVDCLDKSGDNRCESPGGGDPFGDRVDTTGNAGLAGNGNGRLTGDLIPFGG